MVNFVNVVDSSQIEIVHNLANEIWNECYKNIISEKQICYMLKNFQSISEISKSIIEMNEYFLIYYNNLPVGYFCIREECKKMFLSKVYILKEIRRKGIATKVFDYIVETSKNRDLGCIYLTVNRNNERAIKFYKHIGFVIENLVDTNIGNNFYMNDYILYKNVDANK